MSKFTLFCSCAFLSLVAANTAKAQNMAIYSNALVNGWENYSYESTLNFANTSPVSPGSQDSISVNITGGYGAIVFYAAPMSDAPYTNISFWLNGGSSGGQHLQLYGNLGTGPTAQTPRVYLTAPQANTWVEYTVSLSSLGVANSATFSGFAIQDSANTSEPTFYLDDVQLNAATPLTASAGASQTICMGGGASIGGSPTATGGAGGYTYSWSPATGLTSTSVANPLASPTSTTTYTVKVTDTSDATAESGVTVTVSSNPAPTASAGGNQTITAGSATAALGGAVGGGASGGIWTSSGSGTFSPNATTLNATYDPSADDISAGAVTLTLTSTGQTSPCGPATAEVVVTIESDMVIYSNSLVNGWTDASYNTTLNYANTSPVLTGSADSISITITGAYGGIQLYHNAMTDNAYSSISFFLNGGASGGQQLQMYGNLTNGAQTARYQLSAPIANTWQQYVVPLSALGVANVSDFTGFAIQDSAGQTEPAFYLDNIQLVTSVAQLSPLLTINASQPIRTADARWFGLNATIWDNDFDTPQTIALLTNMGIQALRFPGGSTSDDFHWLYNRQDDNDWTWETSLASYIQVVTNTKARTMITLNYGTGTSNEAAAWVAYVNATTTNNVVLGVDTNGFNWGTAGSWAALRAAAPLAKDDGSNFLRISRTAPLGFQYWEIGNEEYGSWETDSNNVPHDPYTYAERASGYIELMKAVDPNIKIGVVAVPGTNTYVNNQNHPATDPVTGQVNYGWTPVLLATLKSLDVTPDFLIYHNYPYNPGGESDAGLLETSETANGWASSAVSLRQMITDYMGQNGANTELVCTENNSVSSNPGKQSVSLVNGLYKLDSLGQLMLTEFNGLFWWALRNGQITTGNMGADLYGWRLFGDYGVVNIGDYTNPNLYPTYYATVLLTNFVQTGDTVVSASSSYSTLSTYAVLRQNGSLTVLTINKDPSNTLTVQLSLTGFNPGPSGIGFSYGIPQDDAVENGSGPTGIAQTNISVTGTNMTWAFPPYSATVLVLPPQRALSSLTASAGANQVICAGDNAPVGGSPTATGGAGGYIYGWSPATGLSSTNTANPTASPTATTTYTVTVTDSSEATSQSEMTVTVNPLPTVNVNSPEMCAGGSANLTATTSASSPSYLWSPGGATNGSILVSPSSTTIYSVAVTDSTTGCTNSGSGTVTVYPIATASAGGNQKICASSGTAALGGSIGGGATGGIWSSSGAGAFTPNATTLNATYNPSAADVAAGTVTLTLTSTGQASPCGGATAEVIVTINPSPSITLGDVPISIYYGSSNAILPYSATSGSPDGYSITYGAIAQAAGFENVALAPLALGPISLIVPSAAGTNTYNGMLTLNDSSTGCTSTNYAFTLTVLPLPVTLTGTRPYDGTAIANSSILTIVTNFDGTNLALSGSATLAGEAVGLEEISDFSGLSLGGIAASNYTLTGANGSVTITNPDLPFSITSAAVTTAGTNLVVCWHSVPGVVYNVLTNSSLGPPQSWAVAGAPITASNTTTCFILPDGIVQSTNVYVVIQQ